MHKGYSGPPPGSKAMALAVHRITIEAVRDGRHSPTVYHFCGGCRKRVASYYYRTTAGVELCPDCADEIGQGPRADEVRFNPKSGHAN
jgi:hypothetical protein